MTGRKKATRTIDVDSHGCLASLGNDRQTFGQRLLFTTLSDFSLVVEYLLARKIERWRRARPRKHSEPKFDLQGDQMELMKMPKNP